MDDLPGLPAMGDRDLQYFDQVPCELRVQGPDRVILHANQAFQDTFGAVVGERCYNVIKHREEQCLVCPAQQTLADGERRDREDVITLKSGETVHLLCTTSPIRGPSGEVESVLVMFRDITAMRQLQDQLTSIGLLVGSISHGIKGLLTGLDGGIYLVNTGNKKDDQARVERGWAMVQRNIDRIRSMVLDILYYAKDRELQNEAIDAADLFGEIGEIIEKKARDLGIALEIDLAPDTGAFEGDARAIRAALLNILENSVEACHSDRTKSAHRVRFRAHREPPWLSFLVEDDGIGMDRETQEKAFSLFFSSKGMKGTGLGLFISNKIVDKHGGTIAVESEQGKGTKFRIRVPLKQEGEEQNEGTGG